MFERADQRSNDQLLKRIKAISATNKEYLL